jgi:hypothetical protein
MVSLSSFRCLNIKSGKAELINNYVFKRRNVLITCGIKKNTYICDIDFDFTHIELKTI